MQSRFVEVESSASPLHLLDFGGAGQPLVMVHGLGGSALNWMAVAPRFAERHRVLAVDLPGFGSSSPEGWRDASVQTSARAVRALLERELRQPAILMGNSMGGLVSLLVAAQAPEQVSGLVLVDPSQPLKLGMPIDWEVTRRFATYALPVLGSRHMRSWGRARGAAGIVEDMLTLCCVDVARIPREVYDAHVRHLEERLKSGTYSERPFLQAAKSLLQLIALPSRFDAATRTAAPTLLVSGTHDRLVPLYLSKHLARRRGWPLEVFEGSGHVPMLEHAHEFAERVGGWLRATFPSAAESA